jgi:hypothetical protein
MLIKENSDLATELHIDSSNQPTLITLKRDGWGVILGAKLEKLVAGDSLAIPPSTYEVLEHSYMSDKTWVPFEVLMQLS